MMSRNNRMMIVFIIIMVTMLMYMGHYAFKISHVFEQSRKEIFAYDAKIHL